MFRTANELSSQFKTDILWSAYIVYRDYCFIWVCGYHYSTKIYTCIREEYLENWLRTLFPNLREGWLGFLEVDRTDRDIYSWYETEAREFYEEYLK